MDTDLIRRCVERAPGWAYNNLQEQPYRHGYYDRYIVTPNLGNFFADSLPQEMLDALAAEMVRMVDALEQYWILHDGHGTAIIHSNFVADGFPKSYEGPDRTLNTLRACDEFFEKC